MITPPVVIPVKPLDAALRRLAGVLGAPERRALQAAMLRDVLSAATAFSQTTVVVTADPLVGALARDRGAVVAPDRDPPAGINAAVARGILAAAGHAVLILMGDLPCATEADLRHVAASAPPGRGVTLAMSGDGTGTNAMLVAPPQLVSPSFGAGSLARHLAAAQAVNADCTVVTAPGLMLDIDTPEDLSTLVRTGGDSATIGLCVEMGFVERLAAASAG
jgi:2-phospho-L-lactate/phosphoenolpyruvate guanylyltransferase